MDGEEAARRMIEIFDCMLQLREYILLPLAIAGDVGNRPHGVAGGPLAMAERTDPHAQPAAVCAGGAGKTNLFLKPLAFARRLEQAKHRFRYVGIADEDPLDRPYILRSLR